MKNEDDDDVFARDLEYSCEVCDEQCGELFEVCSKCRDLAVIKNYLAGRLAALSGENDRLRKAISRLESVARIHTNVITQQEAELAAFRKGEFERVGGVETK